MSNYVRLLRRGKASIARFIQEGFTFRASVLTGTLTAGSSVNYLIQTPTSADEVVLLDHIVAHTADGPVTIEIFEGTAFSAAGSTVTPFNVNRRSSNTTGVTLTKNPTTTNDGTLLSQWKTFVTGAAATQAAIDASLRGDHIILAENEHYLIRVTNNNAGTVGGSISFRWSELAFGG